MTTEVASAHESAMLVRHEASREIERSATATFKACDEARRILLEAERGVGKHFPEGSHMEPHERTVAARALLVGPTRLLARLADEAQILASQALEMAGGLQRERHSAREASNSTAHALYAEAEVRLACLAEELRKVESDGEQF